VPRTPEHRQQLVEYHLALQRPDAAESAPAMLRSPDAWKRSAARYALELVRQDPEHFLDLETGALRYERLAPQFGGPTHPSEVTVAQLGRWIDLLPEVESLLHVLFAPLPPASGTAVECVTCLSEGVHTPCDELYGGPPRCPRHFEQASDDIDRLTETTARYIRDVHGEPCGCLESCPHPDGRTLRCTYCRREVHGVWRSTRPAIVRDGVLLPGFEMDHPNPLDKVSVEESLCVMVKAGAVPEALERVVRATQVLCDRCHSRKTTLERSAGVLRLKGRITRAAHRLESLMQHCNVPDVRMRVATLREEAMSRARELLNDGMAVRYNELQHGPSEDVETRRLHALEAGIDQVLQNDGNDPLGPLHAAIEEWQRQAHQQREVDDYDSECEEILPPLSEWKELDADDAREEEERSDDEEEEVRESDLISTFRRARLHPRWRRCQLTHRKCRKELMVAMDIRTGLHRTDGVDDEFTRWVAPEEFEWWYTARGVWFADHREWWRQTGELPDVYGPPADMGAVFRQLLDEHERFKLKRWRAMKAEYALRIEELHGAVTGVLDAEKAKEKRREDLVIAGSERVKSALAHHVIRCKKREAGMKKKTATRVPKEWEMQDKHTANLLRGTHCTGPAYKAFAKQHGAQYGERHSIARADPCCMFCLLSFGAMVCVNAANLAVPFATQREFDRYGWRYAHPFCIGAFRHLLENTWHFTPEDIEEIRREVGDAAACDYTLIPAFFVREVGYSVSNAYRGAVESEFDQLVAQRIDANLRGAGVEDQRPAIAETAAGTAVQCGDEDEDPIVALAKKRRAKADAAKQGDIKRAKKQ
jgi:hypothetical protein